MKIIPLFIAIGLSLCSVTGKDSIVLTSAPKQVPRGQPASPEYTPRFLVSYKTEDSDGNYNIQLQLIETETGKNQPGSNQSPWDLGKVEGGGVGSVTLLTTCDVGDYGKFQWVAVLLKNDREVARATQEAEGQLAQAPVIRVRGPDKVKAGERVQMEVHAISGSSTAELSAVQLPSGAKFEGGKVVFTVPDKGNYTMVFEASSKAGITNHHVYSVEAE